MAQPETPVLYKVTGPKGEAIQGGSGHWVPGRWRSVRGKLVACERGLHVCTADQLVLYLGPVIWRVEVDATRPVLDAGDKWVVSRARVTERVEAWDERTARLFAADCAERVLPLFERVRPDDPRPREAIAVARRYADGLAADQERAAGAAAWDAAGAAAEAAAGAAERSWQSARLRKLLRLP